MKRSHAQEKRGADKLGGRVNPGSGNGWSRKNDVRTDTESVEYKTTAAKQFTLRLNELKQAEKYALIDDRRMVFGIEMQGHHYVVLTEDDYMDLRSPGLFEESLRLVDVDENEDVWDIFDGGQDI